METKITPIEATLGAVVTGLDLARMDALTWKTVEQAFHEYAVLVFPAQNLSRRGAGGVRQLLRGHRGLGPGS
jgi:alpha-ketoglutarate-dependent taurine dioxygenase